MPASDSPATPNRKGGLPIVAQGCKIVGVDGAPDQPRTGIDGPLELILQGLRLLAAGRPKDLAYVRLLLASNLVRLPALKRARLTKVVIDWRDVIQARLELLNGGPIGSRNPMVLL